MTRYPVLGELNVVTLAVVRMTLVQAHSDGWFTAEMVARSVREITTESAIREVYKVFIREGLMDESVEQGGVRKYHLTNRGFDLLTAVLNS